MTELHRCRVAQMSACITGEILISSMDYANVSFLVFILYSYCVKYSH